MHIWLVSHLPNLKTNAAFLTAVENSKHSAELLSPDEVLLEIGPSLRVRDKESPDLCFIRTGSSAPPEAIHMVSLLEKQGVRCVNSSESISRVRSKAAAGIELCNASIPTPKTLFSSLKAPISNVAEILGPPPWIVKLPISNKGQGVVFVESQTALTTTIDTLRALGQRVLIQEYVEDAAKGDIRVFVINGRVVAAVKRTAKKGDVRSNAYLGSHVEKVALPREAEKIAIECASLFSLEITGVDIVLTKQGPIVLEVNSNPGFQGMQNTLGISIGNYIIEYFESLDLVSR